MTSRVAISPNTSLSQEQLVEGTSLERAAQPFLPGHVALQNDGSQHDDSDAPGSDTDTESASTDTDTNIDTDTETDIEVSDDEPDIDADADDSFVSTDADVSFVSVDADVSFVSADADVSLLSTDADADVSFVSTDADASFASTDADISFMSILEDNDDYCVGETTTPSTASAIMEPSDDGNLSGDETETDEEAQAMTEERRVVKEIKAGMVSTTIAVNQSYR
ncbi:hypothetical protein BGX34_006139 [Mortierella sp. NVP85]|nr:hypothetical protein BGX34_006139 [Mortierella sp. NVP85]